MHMCMRTSPDFSCFVLVGGSTNIIMIIITVLYTYRNLVSLDLWRCRFLSRDSIDTIASNCKNLEEIDIGWWYVCNINPQRACAARVKVLGLFVCLFVCLQLFSHYRL